MLEIVVDSLANHSHVTSSLSKDSSKDSSRDSSKDSKPIMLHYHLAIKT